MNGVQSFRSSVTLSLDSFEEDIENFSLDSHHKHHHHDDDNEDEHVHEHHSHHDSHSHSDHNSTHSLGSCTMSEDTKHAHKLQISS